MDTLREHRTLPMELRVQDGEDGAATIVGHAAVFDTLSEDLGFFREKIDKGAFADSIKEDDVRALFNHDPNVVLGRNKADTLRLKEDGDGLAIEIDPPDTQAANDVLTSIKRGDISQMSFGFQTLIDEWDESDQDNPIRTLKRVKLFDVSPVTFAAYPATDVAVARRSFEGWIRMQKPAIKRRLLAAKHKDAIALCREPHL